MSSFVDQIVDFATESNTNTALCILAGTFLVYFLFFFEKSKKNDKIITKSREITKDIKKDHKVTTQQTPKQTAPVKKVQPNPFLAQYEASQARSLSDAAKYIEANFKKEKEEESYDSLFDELLATAPAVVGASAITRQIASSKPITEDAMSKLHVTKNADKLTKSKKEESEPMIRKAHVVVEPFLARFEATTASTTLEAREYILSLPKPPSPFLANYEACTASHLLVSQSYAASLPKPFLASYEATTALTALNNKKYIDSLPKPPRPCLAAFEATTALTALNNKKYIESLPKPPRPCLAAFEATTAHSLQVSATYAASLPKMPKPFLARYEATVASTLMNSKEYINQLVKSDSTYVKSVQLIKKVAKPVESLATYEATTATTTLAAKKYIQSLVESSEYVKPTPAVERLEQREAEEIDFEELSSNSSVSEVSTSTLSSEVSVPNNKEIQDSNVDTVDQAQSQQRLDLSWDELYSGDNNKRSIRAVVPSATIVEEPPKPWVTTTLCIYYPNCTNKNCKFVHPGTDNNPRPKPKRSATIATEPKRIWSRHERIERQSQTHFPIWKSRCVHWPFCTNNHCKYSHPIKECR
ncbi:hypothetical protein BD560DRAFT_404616 [Blakeslea trispora]|nr:hypothetical protein BD560DRAFT_404616 [Blakeslea trispora]